MAGPTDVTGKPGLVLPCVSQGHVCSHARSQRNPVALSGRQTFSPRPTTEVGDTRLTGVSFKSNPMSEETLERQPVWIMRYALIVQGKEYPFSKDVIVDEPGAKDPNLTVMAKVLSLIEVFRLGGS